MKNAYDIILKPVITEQSMEATEEKKYVFRSPSTPTRARSRRQWRRSSA